MKKRLSALLLLSCLWGYAAPLARAQDATAYAVADATTCHLLDSRNPNKKLPVASLTKIATAMVVLDWLDVSKQEQGSLAVVPPGALSLDPGNPLGFQAGDQVSIRDLLYAMLLQSDNIAAYTLANHVGHDLQRSYQSDARPVDLFVAQMNALARKLGMTRTVFLNPHGLELGENPHSTARDLVVLTSEALKRSAFRFYVSQRQRQITRHTAAGASAAVNLTNTNDLLGINAIDGVKTGNSARAGGCAVISAARAPESVQNADESYTITPRRLIVVVLGSSGRFNDAKQLLNNGWNLYDEWAAQGRPLEK
ncbi:MAG: serine hydrolase [Chthoniobacteraceae bacterium]|nr:serine hydrolase [Chthoniobacteraceae bacterium]